MTSQATYSLSWGLSFVVLTGFAGWLGTKTKYGKLGILVDSRGRFSLTHLQAVLWALLIPSSLIGVFIASGLDPGSLRLPPELMGLIGVSAGSAALATGVKAAKDAPGSTARVARLGEVIVRAKTGPTPRNTPARLEQIWLQEEGDNADQVVDVTKFQNFIITLVVAVAYATLSVRQAGLPMLPGEVVWLIGISHAGYVVGKIPNRE